MVEVKIIEETCCTDGCGIMFWIAEDFRNRLISTKRTFYCPNGHSMSYQGESDKQKIARLLIEKAQVIREKEIEIAAIKRKCARKPRTKK